MNEETAHVKEKKSASPEENQNKSKDEKHLRAAFVEQDGRRDDYSRLLDATLRKRGPARRALLGSTNF